MKPSKHEHDGLSFSNLLHWELGPQGDGMHGFCGGITVGCSTEIQFFFFLNKIIALETNTKMKQTTKKMSSELTYFITMSERITSVRQRTFTNRRMIDHRTFSRCTTSAWTRINTAKI